VDNECTLYISIVLAICVQKKIMCIIGKEEEEEISQSSDENKLCHFWHTL